MRREFLILILILHEVCALVAQLVEHVHGKDGVTSSNLVKGSTSPRSYEASLFPISLLLLFDTQSYGLEGKRNEEI